MTPTWYSDSPPAPARISLSGWALAALRAVTLTGIVLGGLMLLLLVRLFEKPIFAAQRPWSPVITLWVCRISLSVIGIRHHIHGQPTASAGAIVANHSTWLDIFALNACERVYFVAKSEVAGWPGIGWLARATGTVFIRRNRAEAKAQTALLGQRLAAGHKLLFFPEGTSTDGSMVLPFKSTLFAAFFSEKSCPAQQLQPVSVVYRPPPGRDARFYGWWGDMVLGPHMLKILAAYPGGSVRVIYHPPLAISDFANRKELAQACEQAVRSGMTAQDSA